jgi:hypothetical protein
VAGERSEGVDTAEIEIKIDPGANANPAHPVTGVIAGD